MPIPEQDITFQQWGDMLAGFSQYRQLPGNQPEASLRRGLLEEVLEANFGDKELSRIAAAQTSGDSRAALGSHERLEREGEIADVWYYIRQIGSYFTVPDSEIVGEASTIAGFQQQADTSILPIQDAGGNSLAFTSEAETKNRLLAVTALRVVDVMNPKETHLWVGVTDGRPRLGRALMDLAKVTAFICRDEGLRLPRGMVKVYTKLSERQRKPAVLSEASAGIITSGRARFGVMPWVNKLVLNSVAAHYDSTAPKPYDVIAASSDGNTHGDTHTP